MYKTDHDKIAEKIRAEGHASLVDQYQAQHAENPEWHGLNVRGHEVPDPTVMEPPIGFVPGPDLIEQIRAMVRTELSKKAEEEGMETFEEADDFDVDDDLDPTSPYEAYFDPPPGAPAGPPAPPQTPPGEPPPAGASPPGPGAEPPPAKPE